MNTNTAPIRELLSIFKQPDHLQLLLQRYGNINRQLDAYIYSPTKLSYNSSILMYLLCTIMSVM